MARLGDILLRSRQLTDSQLSTAIAEQQRWGGLLGEILLRMDYISEPILVDALTRQMGVAAADLAILRNPEPTALRRLTLEVAKKLRAVPLSVKDKGKLMTVAMCEPQNLVLLDELRKATGCRITPLLIGPLTFIRLLNDHYGAQDVEEGEEPPESSFKMVDSQGNTIVRSIADIKPTSKPPLPPPGTATSGPPRLSALPVPGPARTGSALANQLTDLESTQRQEVAALRAMVELLIERGVFTREEYLARVRK
jgi:hypothetical protein